MKHGLREAHVHLPMLGRALTLLDVGHVRSCSELLDVLAPKVRALSAGKWFVATGLRVDSWDLPRWPTRHDLDQLSTSHGIIVRGFDYHSLVANTLALNLAGVSHSASVWDSTLVRRDLSGDPTGVCLEGAAQRVCDAVPEPDALEREIQLTAAIEHLVALGFDEAHDMLSPAWLGPALAARTMRGGLPLKVRLFPLVEDLPAAVTRRGTWECEGVSLGGGKLFADGTLNARTAWMLTPYADGFPTHPSGVPNWNPDQLAAAVRTCEHLDLPLATHAIGDRAVRETLDAIEHAGTKRSIRHRIEHCEVVDAADIKRFAQLGVVASVQPCHLLYDIEVLRRALPHRLEQVLPLRDMIESGLVPGQSLIFGSDAPIVPADPADSIQAAVQRRRVGMAPSDAIGPEQAIAAAEAWKCFGR